MKSLAKNRFVAKALDEIDRVDEYSDEFVLNMYQKWQQEAAIDDKKTSLEEFSKHSRHHPIVKDHDTYTDNPTIDDWYFYHYADEYKTIGHRGCRRAIKRPNCKFLGVFERIRYSEYIFWWALPVALTFNIFIGPWKIFRQSMLWIAGLGTFMEILTIMEEKIAAFFINIYLLLLIPTWLMV